MKGFVFGLLIFGFTILFSEFLFRISGKYLTYSEKTNSVYISPYAEESRSEHIFRYNPEININLHNKEFKFQRKINELGFTDHRKPEEFLNRFSILALGDSYTVGLGSSYQESWPYMMEKLLNKTEDEYRVYNSGISGNDPFFEFQNLKFLFPKIQPRIVIMLVNRSDFSDVILRGGMERFQKDGSVIYQKEAPWWEPLYKWSHLVRAFFHSPLADIWSPSLFEEGTPGILAALDSCDNYTRKHMGIFLPAYLPIPVNGKVVITPEEKILLDSMRAKYGMLFLDLTDSVRLHADHKYFWKLDSHCTSAGYEVIARSLHTHLMTNVIHQSNSSGSKE